MDERRLAIWLKPEDLVSLIRIGLEREGLVYEMVYGMSDNARAWWDNSRARELGYRPEGRSEEFAAKRSRRRRCCRRTRWARPFRAALSARKNLKAN